MATIDPRTTELNRRKFLGLTGGLAVAGAAAACGQGGTYDPPLGRAKEQAPDMAGMGSPAAASPTPTGAMTWQQMDAMHKKGVDAFLANTKAPIT